MRLFSRKRKASLQILTSSRANDFPRKMVVQESKLLALPDEILVHIVSFLNLGEDTGSPGGLLETRLTCSNLKALADPFLYESYQILQGEKSERLAVLLARDERRATWLRSVLVSTKYDDDRGLEHFPSYLRAMRNLRRLILETPDCNSKSPDDRVKWVQLQKQYELIFQQSSVAVPLEDRLLPMLEECTLHFVDDTVSLYPLTKYSSIFLHPTLKSLTLSCACTDMAGKILKDHRHLKRSTALEHVHFEECDFDADSLEILLKFPKALKSLRLSEGVRYSDDFGSRHSRLHGNLNPGTLSHALTKSVGHSLETLSLSLGFQRSRGQSINAPGRSLDLSGLVNLKRLEISMTTLGLLITRPKCDHQTYRRLPLSLETIRVFTIPMLILRGKPPVPFQSCLFKDKTTHGLPNLKHLIYCYEYQAPRGRSSFGLIQHRGEDAVTRIINQSKDNVKDINDRNYHIYKRNGIRVTVENEVTPPGFIPPYLHNEEKPTRGIMWDTAEPTFNALCIEDRSNQAARAALFNRNATTNEMGDLFDDGGGVEGFVDAQNARRTAASDDEDEVNGVEEDEDEGSNPLALMHLAPQAQELFELLVMQPGQPFQL
ncbi:hypothetical protein LTR70_004982 [Exophiala xenobiotica]|uniref:F-box domain-containing protein n=1 Tax=Lithohypha guttulata TaxID=1690604 RepID=A0ABR0KBZ0_9EURO|nr:hypothetical protein LTR24_004385 [Lithohypha guttulata]KAK5319363.1 hypothetical protein LTR70_004982 [Exophiala xenobiotica]